MKKIPDSKTDFFRALSLSLPLSLALSLSLSLFSLSYSRMCNQKNVITSRNPFSCKVCLACFISVAFFCFSVEYEKLLQIFVFFRNTENYGTEYLSSDIFHAVKYVPEILK